MFVNRNQKALVDIGAKTFMDDQICLSLLHSAKYIKPQSRTRYAAPAYCYLRYERQYGTFPKGPEEQIKAWNEFTPKFIDRGQCSAAVVSLLDAPTEDLSMVNSILSAPILPRKDFGPVKKRVQGEPITNVISGPTVNFYIPPLKGSATIQQGAASGQEKVFLPALGLSRVKADVTSAPDFTGKTSIKLEDVLAALHANPREVIRQDPPKQLLGTQSYIPPLERGIRFI